MVGSEDRNAPFIVALSGHPGAGKTTVARRLAGTMSKARHVAYDDYQSVTTLSHQDLEAWWFDRGGDCNEFELAALERELVRRDGPGWQPLIVFETPFGRTHRATGRLIDLLVWIDIPFDVALARQVRQFVTEALRKGGPPEGFLRWLDGYIDNYQRLVRAMYRRQRDDIMPTADLVVDGTMTPDAVAATIRAFVLERLPANDEITPGASPAR